MIQGEERMNQEWTLHVERIGKIAKADIRIAPLIFFIGDNNSGKSYMMTILWGLLFLGKNLFPARSSDSRAYKRCEDWLREHVDKESMLDDAVVALYLDWFNELLIQRKKDFLCHLFNYVMESGKMEVRDYRQKKPLKLHFREGKRYAFHAGSDISFPQSETYTREELLRMNTYICWNLLMGDIAAPLYTPVMRGRRNGEPVYLPASRTGFMLTYKQLLEQSIQANFSQTAVGDRGALTLPYVDFLQLITKFESPRANALADHLMPFLETYMTDGSFKIKRMILPDFQYTPKDVGADMPLYITSSVITELAPLSLLLQSGINFKTIIIEEPEAHLHPALQKRMAQFIVRLVNNKKSVWVTTHSDTVLQHVNNMLKLAKRPAAERRQLMERFDYEAVDLLQDRQVRMYQFSKESEELRDPAEQGKTVVQELKPQKYGFEVPSFNDALERILDEVYAFQGEDD